MSDTRTTWIPIAIAGLGVIGTVFGVWLAMSTQSAVRGEQIRRIQEDARRLESSWEKHTVVLESDDKTNANRIRLVEREVDGLGPVVKAIKEIADSNAIKLDALLLRGRISNNGLVSTGASGR